MKEKDKELTNLVQVDRPRERLVSSGTAALSVQELLAIVLRSGTKEDSVMQLAKKLLGCFDSLYDFKLASLEELQQTKGIGLVKAVELQAVLELGRRLAKENQQKYGEVISSRSVGLLLIEELKDLRQEHLVALYLNNKNEIIKQETLFIGGLNQAVVHPREIFSYAVKCCAAKFIIAHNHREKRS
ncbi:RadC family protein [Vagococcus intermedius]|uniref:DNA repair protein RadC n=1 Tax=Vagococcus intermedius TaxID=2991418 RepID=A0AAF0CW26_9ENTE|nr:DNA repair protein RadC [Vagococcus intermedius]WEG73924.1 DNA repair protein RadC [Vagococcus intermedius]WEG76006.1 DNA repair protein RadC [Vagococcus intermedius]